MRVMLLSTPILADILEALVNHLADILKAASANVLGLLALIVVAFAVIAGIGLSRYGRSPRLAVFFGLGAIGMFLIVALRTASSWPDSAKRSPEATPRAPAVVIAGRILDASNEQGIPGLTVLLEGAASPGPHDDTDGVGNFHFGPLSTTDISALRLSLETTEYEPKSWRLSPADTISSLRILVRKTRSSKGATAARRSGSGVRQTTTRVAGKVLDAGTRSPLQGATVVVRGFVSPAPETPTDSSGNFLFDIPQSDEKPVTPHVFVNAPGYETLDLRLSPGQAWSDLDIRLKSSATRNLPSDK